MASPDITQRYPKKLRLNDGREFTIRVMEATDADRSLILKFANGLQEDDLFYVRTDITDLVVVSQWIENLRTGHTFSPIAELDKDVARYASVHREPARWTRSVGELRINAAQRFRGVGLGRALVAEAFSVGQLLGLRKLCGMLTPEQNGARTAFERLGFRVEAALQDWVVGRRGRPHDILVMNIDLDGVTNEVA